MDREQFYEAVMNANARLNGLLWCFACFGAQPEAEPVETVAVAAQLKGFLEAELREEEVLFEAGREAGLYPSIAACMCLRDAIKNLSLMIDESQEEEEEQEPGKETSFGWQLILFKKIVLPIQTRDKHRKNLCKRGGFLQRSARPDQTAEPNGRGTCFGIATRRHHAGESTAAVGIGVLPQIASG
jgi:hypothetical protein